MNLSLFRNLASLTAAETFSKVITFACFAYVARLFGPSGYGAVEWAATVLMCASLIVDQGFNSYGAREIARRPSDTKRLVAEVVTARFLLAATAYFLTAAFAYFYVVETAVTRLLLVSGVSLWLMPLMLQWVFQGHDRMHLVGITQTIRQSVFVLSVFLFVRGTSDIVWVGVAEVAGVACAALFSVWIYRRSFGGGLAPLPSFSAKLFREGAPIGLSHMLWVLKMFGATFLIGLIATAEDTGYFAGAMRIYIALHTFVWLYFFNLLPSLTRAWEMGPDQLAGITRRSFWLVCIAAVPAAAVWITAAPFVMTGVYGSGFLPGAAALQWLAGACVAAALSGHYRYALIAAGHQGKELLATGIGSILAVILVPIGYFNAGIAGAATALFAAECVVFISSLGFARRSLFGSSGVRLSPDDSSLAPVARTAQ